MNKQSPAAKLMAERESLMQRLRDAGIAVRHSRLRGMEMMADPRLGWEPLVYERAEQYLRMMRPPSKLNISCMDWRD